MGGGPNAHESQASHQVLEEDGWYLVATRGSHRQFKHPVKPGRMIVPGNMSDDIAVKTGRAC